ncbi:ABC transporter ATP-binding protein/permease [Streptococcus cuniculi]|uniref:ABC transporter ATP-binding protein/permease n=1 Tax=Streptococcus cuniculi TaxID=1432788 RepID=A0A4Y9JAZ3_9STRE|nr:ABC transporter ATP-binding protein/permease [Streptococcus cuniculi]MBF0778418.1 ABC transporter ATP-binding protein/permease [Streptococcus cuniculi]TFU97701.1 ABC transporter ATP-binding protein/permease [Streptococcus cuniculi]
MSQTQQLSREKKKYLLARLKEQIRPKLYLVYLAAFLSWIPFLVRILSFYWLSRAFAAYMTKEAFHLSDLVFRLVIINLAGFAVSLFAKRLQGIGSQFARDALKKSFFEVLMARDGQFESAATAADVFTVASQGIDSLDTYYSHYLSMSLRTYLNCTTVLLLVAWIFPIGSLIFLLALPLIPVSILLMQKPSQRIMNRYWASYMDVGNLFLDDLQGLNTLYSYQADAVYEKMFNEQAEEFRDATMELLGFQLQAVGYMDAVMYLGIGISGFVAISQLVAGHLSLFSFIFFILIATEFFAPIREQGYGMHLVMMNTKMADRIFRFLDSIEEQDVEITTTLGSFDWARLENISFSYGEKVVLQEINFDMSAGHLYGIAGVSGQGKTTVAHLLMKRLIAQQGEIIFGGTSLEHLSQVALNRQVLYVSSQSYLLNQSIYDNLAMACEWTKEDMLAWMDRHGVLQFIHDLPAGLDTIVGENGQHLSSGQRQQLICARAILANRSLYIFDEITSNVDADNETFIYDLIQLVAETAIVVVITHKMKQVYLADKVLFLAEHHSFVGSAEELYRENPAFRHLVDTQAELEGAVYG